MSTKRIGKWYAPVLGLVIRAVSPVIEKTMEGAVRHLYEAAQKTENEIDNIFVELLADLLDIEL